MLQKPCHHLASRRGAGATRLAIVAAAAKTAGKGFGNKPVQQEDARKPGGDKRVARDAASGASKARPVRPEEAARGKLDYVQVADWGDGNRSKLGELKMVSHVTTYEGSAAAAAAAAALAGATAGQGAADPAGGGGAGAAAGAGVDTRPFHTQLAHQLQMAEARGALAVAGPPPPPVSQWSWREGRYRQYLSDLAEVHAALESAVEEATAAVASTSGRGGAGEGSSAAVEALQSPHAALAHLRPGRLGLERAAALRRDLAALIATAQQAPEAVAAAAADRPGSGSSSGSSGAGASLPSAAAAHGKGKAAMEAAAGAGTAVAVAAAPRPSGPMARSYGQLLSRLGRVAAAGETEQVRGCGGAAAAGTVCVCTERQAAALRLLAHAAVLHLVGQAAGTALGATAAERLGLLQRRAAAAYHEYPEQVKDPRITLAAALDAAGSHLSSRPEWVQAVFEEVSGAMTKTSLLLTALAHKD
ncbi:hypothetical protein CHLRE_03g156500v5 [Chlamydomonas reinhardtii]|uniref:Uncharacterized protein n=1 Tax=Chlamydomonas reinhardtii TaxID=3055 RepID=A0A2K3DW22_CHLRE|nr:uncharacterized protein CHLRE_03g156500v5 [Chlamydomonas reinhardtii]PNW84733.1 hypothetical protein CHLRE_03g156500v5 [Chlamydomonas reinhardtii]